MIRLAIPLMFGVLATAVAVSEIMAAPHPTVLEAEHGRIEVIKKISRPTLAIIDRKGQGVGSGVVISQDGYALTNFHVSAPCGPAMSCGMTDGKLYDAVIVGIDPTGDVALIKLMGRDDFPAATIGDSDKVRVGEWAYVVGNPFVLADDFQPTVTYGIISGVHRYQYPSGTLLEYADCIQTDAAINPGNSGGPLFDAEGRLIGINGRGSFEKRGRVNVGVGYAISINQIQKFLGCLKSGRIVDHASLGATVTTDGSGRVVVDDILEDSDAFRRGLRYGDEIVRFGDRDISTVNGFKNILGTYPNRWRVPLVFRREGEEYQTQVRLSSLHREGELLELLNQNAIPLPEQPKRGVPEGEDFPESEDAEIHLPGEPESALPAALAQLYESRTGYANYFFNRQFRNEIWQAFASSLSESAFSPDWKIEGRVETGGRFTMEFSAEEAVIEMPSAVSRARFDAGNLAVPSPPNSGGLLQAVHFWQRLLEVGLSGSDDVRYFGELPWDRNDQLTSCLVLSHQGIESFFYFSSGSGDLIGIEYFTDPDSDPCEMYFSDFRDQDGWRLPYRWMVKYGDHTYAVLEVENYDLQPTSL